MNATHRKKRIGVEDQDGKGSTPAYVIWFTNAINQRRQIAHDGVKWWVQANPRACFKPVGEIEVPSHTKLAMQAYMRGEGSDDQ